MANVIVKVYDGLGNEHDIDSEKIGELSELNTDAKDSVVNAINEVYEKANTPDIDPDVIGNIEELETDAKDSLVNAINEVDGRVPKVTTADEGHFVRVVKGKLSTAPINSTVEEWVFTLDDDSTVTKKVVVME